MSAALCRPVEAVAWDLRAAWASGKRVALSLDLDQPSRLEGHVRRVAPSGAFVELAGRQVPLGRVLAVHYPSILGDSTFRSGQWWGPPGRVEQLPGQLPLWLSEELVADRAADVQAHEGGDHRP